MWLSWDKSSFLSSENQVFVISFIVDFFNLFILPLGTDNNLFFKRKINNYFRKNTLIIKALLISMQRKIIEDHSTGDISLISLSKKPLQAPKPQVLSTEILHLLPARLPTHLLLRRLLPVLPRPKSLRAPPVEIAFVIVNNGVVAVTFRFGDGVENLLQANDSPTHLPPCFPYRRVDSRD